MKENQMLENIEKDINSEQFKYILKSMWKRTEDINIISNLIGEFYTINIINKDGDYSDYYLNHMQAAYLNMEKKKISKEEFNYKKAKLIADIICLKLKIDKTNDSNKNEDKKIKDYFIKEYVEDGYVTHAYHDADDEDLKEGFTPGLSFDENYEIKDINCLFMELGLPAVMGPFPHCEKYGISLNHNLKQTYIDAINSPEWFNWFTSSNHNSEFHHLDESPFILRSEKDCRSNVLDLCYNSRLDLSESMCVMKFYNKYYEKYSSPNLNVAFISKKHLDEDHIYIENYDNLGAISTIKDIILKDEEIGLNNYEIYLNPENIKRTSLPISNEYLSVDNYNKENYQDLYNSKANSDLKLKIRQFQNHNQQENIKVLKKVL